jgi:prepilin-type N-terminal cleavage/methylation domain-containing protein
MRRSFLTPPHRAGRGFTLVEMLSVIAILALVAVAGMPSLNGIFSASNSSAIPLKVSAFLENARQQATARNTYVYVSLSETVDASGRPQLWLGAVTANSGEDVSKAGAQDLVIGNGDTQVRQLGPLMKIENVRPVPSTDIPANLIERPSGQGVADLTASTPAKVRSLGGADLPVSFWFAPDGTALRTRTPHEQLELAIRSPHEASIGQASVLQISSLTGAVRTYRVQ